LPETERALLWRAVFALRTAETLADLASVAGPSDSPPELAADFGSFASDWADRARRALSKAQQWAIEKPVQAARERAQRVAQQVSRGARAIVRAGKRIAAWPKRTVQLLGRAADEMATRAAVSAVVTVAVVGAVAWWYFANRRT
jgi:lysozyme family protein